jgi:hypothetical protein
MHITRSQPEEATLSCRLKWWQFLQRFRQWEADRDYHRIETALERHQSRLWTNRLQCLHCRSIVARNAKYCQICGIDMSPTTEPMLPIVPTRKVLHPPVNGLYARLYNHVPGGTHTKTIKAVNLVEIAERQATDALSLHKKEGHTQ